MYTTIGDRTTNKRLVPRTYQSRIADAARRAYAIGKRRIIIHAPTGAGKTFIASMLIAGAVEKGSKVLFLANRRELIKQSASRLSEAGIQHGIIMAGVEPDLTQQVQIASMQTYLRRMHLDDPVFNPWWHNAAMVVVDECHTSISPSYRKILDTYGPSVVTIGLTATPARGDGRGLGEFYDELVSEVGMKELVENKFLVPTRYFVPSTPDLAKVRTVRGDYDQQQLADRVNTKQLVGDIVENWLRIAPDRQTVVFAVNVAHSLAIKQAFERQGISVAHMDASTPSDERDYVLTSLNNGDIQVVTNVGILTEGMDFPIVACIVLARPTKSLPLYLQMAGRGVRTHDGKSDCIIQDHGGNVERHGPIDEEYAWKLDGSCKAWSIPKKREPTVNVVKCRVCHEMFMGVSACPTCGTEVRRFPVGIEVIEAELKEIEAQKAPKVWSDSEKIMAYGMLKHQEKQYGWNPGRKAHLYKTIFGVWPYGKVRRAAPTKPSGMMGGMIKWANIKSAKAYQKRRAKK